MRKRNEDYITSENILKDIEKLRLPILCLDRKWLALFNNDEKTDAIKNLEKNVTSVMKSQGAINTKRDELKVLKKKLMKEIVSNMDAKANSKAEKKVEKSKELIEEINDQLILLEDKELDIPSNLNKANARLAYKSLEELYVRKNSYEEDIDTLETWINETRVELKKKILLREKRVEELEKIDNYLDSVFSKEILNEYRQYKVGDL